MLSDEIHDLQEHDLPLPQLGRVIFDLKTEHNQDVQTALPEVAEAHLAGALLGQRMIDDEPPDVANQIFQLFARGIVGELQEESLATLGSEAEVFDRRVHDRAARNFERLIPPVA